MIPHKSYWYYTPVVICLALGYITGAVLSFGVMYLNIFPEVSDSTARFLLIIFGIGMLGATTYSSQYWAKDIEKVVYKDQDGKPHFYDFVGYLSMIVEGGLSGVILYFLVKTGLVITTSNIDLAINLPATVIIAYCGGLFHFDVVNVLKKIAKEKINGNSPQV